MRSPAKHGARCPARVRRVTNPASLRLRRPPPLAATLRPPGSKSLTNRALLLAAMAHGRTRVEGLLDSEDTRIMRKCLRDLGVVLTEIDPTTAEIVGCGSKLGAGFQGQLEVGTAGTAARFLTGVLAGSHSGATIEIDGSARMRERPMAALLDGLRQMGARLDPICKSDHLPLRIHSAPLRGTQITLPRPASSQFVSALVLAALGAEGATRIVLRQGTPARPYVDMTLAQIDHFGGRARWTAPNVLEIEASTLEGRNVKVEPDASSASYFLGLAAIHGGEVHIPQLGAASLQGDARFHEILATMGAKTQQDLDSTRLIGTGRLTGAELDLTAMPDMTLTAAVVALFAKGRTSIRGVEVLRHHESDRIAAGAAELRKLGATVQEHDDGMTIDAPIDGPLPGVKISTYDDHRMAMAFAMVGDVHILDPMCCGKTFPHYFDELKTLAMVPAQ